MILKVYAADGPRITTRESGWGKLKGVVISGY
jgi:hypothetical protein